MIKRLVAIGLLGLTTQGAAHAADVGVSISIGQPGFYGRIDIGRFPQPQVIYAEPRVIVETVDVMDVEADERFADASVADPVTQQVLEGVVADERRHLGFGENDLGRRLARHPEHRERLAAVRAELDPLVLRSFEEAYRALGLGAADRPALGRDYLHSVERLGLTA